MVALFFVDYACASNLYIITFYLSVHLFISFIPYLSLVKLLFFLLNLIKLLVQANVINILYTYTLVFCTKIEQRFKFSCKERYLRHDKCNLNSRYVAFLTYDEVKARLHRHINKPGRLIYNLKSGSFLARSAFYRLFYLSV